MINLLLKPAKGGKPKMESKPITIQAAVKGITFPSPFKSSIFVKPERSRNAPVQRKIKSFIMAWLKIWNKTPVVVK
jgi:hypothetical protein